ncbi:MAG: hypothetical protein XD49_1376, partial [Caldanaerobacter subterraneus]
RICGDWRQKQLKIIMQKDIILTR